MVTTRATVMEEVAGDAAVLIESGSQRELADAMTALSSQSSAERAAMAARGRARAEAFTWDRCVDQHLVAYHSARGE